jgi:hypothetical protein
MLKPWNKVLSYGEEQSNAERAVTEHPQPWTLTKQASSVMDSLLNLKNYGGIYTYYEYTNKLRGLNPQANYTDRETAACRS